MALGIKSELGRGAAPTWGMTSHGEGVREDGSGGVRSKATALAYEGHASLVVLKRSGRKANATPGGSRMPAADYGKSGARGDGRGRAAP